MNSLDKAYQDLLQEILAKGVVKSDRTGTGTISLFGKTLRFDMKEGFPLLTTKKIHTKSVIHELLWFLKGSSNIKYLVDNGVSIWNEWPWQAYVKATSSNISIEDFAKQIKNDVDFAEKWGELGPVYGKQWREWHAYDMREEHRKKNDSYHKTVDQIKNLIDTLKTNPDDRRMLVSAWNVTDIDKMLLPPCHYGFQCWTRELSLEERIKIFNSKIDRKEIPYHTSDDKLDSSILNKWNEKVLDDNVPKRALSLMWNQRSVDTFLGLPFNIASYGFLLEMIAHCTNMISDELIFCGGDCHIYLNHVDQVNTQLERTHFDLPRLFIENKSKDIDSFKYEDFIVEGYESHPAIKAPIAI